MLEVSLFLQLTVDYFYLNDLNVDNENDGD